MCLSLTPTGVFHAVDVTECPNLPAGKPYLLRPLPGARQHECPHPCGRPCQFISALPAPAPLPARLLLRLRLAPTLAALVADALAVREPAGAAADAQPAPMAYGSLRYYRN